MRWQLPNKTRRSTPRSSAASWRQPTERIILFGSRARRDHRPDSDLDILVIAESDEPRSVRSRKLYIATSSIARDVDADILVYTPDEVREWSSAPRAFVTTALREGRVLYEKQ